MNDRWLIAWGLASTSFGGASLIIPLYVVQLGGTAATLGTMAALAAFLGVPGALIAGPYADRGGRHRRVLLTSFVVVMAVLLTIPLIENIEIIVLSNAVIWFCFASVIPVLTLLAVAEEPEARWSERIASLNKYQGVGWGIGLVIGAIASGLGSLWFATITVQRILLVVYGLIAVVGILCGVRWLPTAQHPPAEFDPKRVRRAINRATRFNLRGVTFPITPARIDPRAMNPRQFIDRFTPPLAAFFIAIVLCFAGFAAFFSPLPAFLADAQLGDSDIFALYVLSSAAAAVCFSWAGTLAASHGIFRVHTGALTIRGIAFPVAAGIVTIIGIGSMGLIGLAIAFIGIGISWAIIIVTAGTLVTQLSPPTIRGESLGMYGALMALAGGIGSFVGGRLAVVDYILAFTVAGGLVILGAGIVVGIASSGVDVKQR